MQDKILAMPEGKEIDDLVAEKVMGWHIVTEHGREAWHDSEGRYQHLVAREDAMYEDDEDLHLICWHPSSSMLWAWDVVEKFKQDGKWLSISTSFIGSSDMWCCEYSDNNIQSEVSFCLAETAPLAICRAALLAVAKDEHGR